VVAGLWWRLRRWCYLVGQALAAPYLHHHSGHHHLPSPLVLAQNHRRAASSGCLMNENSTEARAATLRRGWRRHAVWRLASVPLTLGRVVVPTECCRTGAGRSGTGIAARLPLTPPAEHTQRRHHTDRAHEVKLDWPEEHHPVATKP
jgi:hypothetical protein